MCQLHRADNGDARIPEDAVAADSRSLQGKISVILPAYNESKSIESNVVETCDTLEQLRCDFEVILVDDGSPDDTYLFAARAKTYHPERVRVVRYDRNQGKGNALMCGTRYASGDYVVFLDADMDLHPNQLPRFFQIMEETGADGVIGSKRHPLSRVNYPRIRQIYSFFYYSLVRILFNLPLQDTQTGLKVFRIELLHDVFPRVLAKRFAFDIELLAIAQHLGYKLREAPVQLAFQRKFNRIKLNDVRNIFLDTLAIFYRLRIARYYDRPHENDDQVDIDAREYERV